MAGGLPADGDALLRAGGRTLLLTALGPALDRLGLAPDPAAHQTLAAATLLNADRNDTLLRQIEEVAAGLNAAGIVPMIIKGGCHLITGLWSDPGARFVGDIDLLLPPGSGAAALAAMPEGCSAIEDDWHVPDLIAATKHLPAMHKPGWEAAVELHTAVVDLPYAALIPTAGLFQRAREVRLGAASLLLPAPDDQALIAMLHGPIGHETYRAPALMPRDLVDLALLRARHGAAIDWPALQAGLRRQGWGALCAVQNRMFGDVLGVAGPFPPPTAREALSAWRWFRQLDTTPWRRLGGVWARVHKMGWLVLRGPSVRRYYLHKLTRARTYREAWASLAGLPGRR